MALSLQRYTWPYHRTDKHLQCLYKLNNIRIDDQEDEERPMAVATNILNVLPEALMIEILCFLPVEDLLRCKCVCKSWNALISSSDFVSKHLKNYYYNYQHTRQSCLVHIREVPNELGLFELVIDEALTVPKVVASEAIDHRPMYGSYICGPCDGLYYLYDYYSGQRALWNPAIKELKLLPSLPNPQINFTYYFGCEAHGIRVDPLTKDYKVVVIKGYRPEDEDIEITYPPSIFVYSLQTDCWTYCGDLSQIHPFSLEPNKCYTF